MADKVGADLAEQLRSRSLELYTFARDYCEERGIMLADCKLEFGLVDGKLILIDEIFTPDASRFWAKEKYALDIEIDSMDKRTGACLPGRFGLGQEQPARSAAGACG
ncbi:hypothetical protein HMSSN036_17130 [Paenibacillus macerans]|nr:hypothetical protein HMSSN036_17130 [Paenibacillus macerans]